MGLKFKRQIWQVLKSIAKFALIGDTRRFLVKLDYISMLREPHRTVVGNTTQRGVRLSRNINLRASGKTGEIHLALVPTAQRFHFASSY
jgi:hypothetical protein